MMSTGVGVDVDGQWYRRALFPTGDVSDGRCFRRALPVAIILRPVGAGVGSPERATDDRIGQRPITTAIITPHHNGDHHTRSPCPITTPDRHARSPRPITLSDYHGRSQRPITPNRNADHHTQSPDRSADRPIVTPIKSPVDRMNNKKWPRHVPGPFIQDDLCLY